MFLIYSKPNCAYCTYAKQLLDSVNESYEEYDVYSNLDTITESIGERPKTVPQIFKGAEHIGGYEELVEYIKNG